MTNAYITITNVNKKIKTQQILKNINVTFEQGKTHGIVGRNGSGKSMLLKTISGLTPVTSGEIIVNGNVLGKDCDFPENMSCIIESPGFLSAESGLNNLKYLQSLTQKPDKQYLVKIMEQVGLKEHMHKKAGKYSTGMKQRLGLAQVLMDNNDLIILDEPLNGLDEKAMKEFRDILLNMKKKNKTLLIATHMPEDVEMLCDTVSKMSNGELIRIR